MAIDLDTPIPPNQPISVDTSEEGNPAPSAPVADNRAYKTHYGLGDDLQMSIPQLYTSYIQGQENNIRQQATSALLAKQQQAKSDKVMGLIRQGKTLTIDEMNKLQDTPIDPNSVVEDSYAKKYMSNIWNADINIGGTDLAKGTSIFPDLVQQDIDTATQNMGNREYAIRKVEDLQDTVSSQGWIPWAVDQAKTMVPFYEDVKLRGWMENVGKVDGFTLGNNLYEQTRSLLRLPGPEFRDKFDYITGKLREDNPSLALRYANAVVGMSTSDVLEQNLGNILADEPVLKIAAVKSLNTIRKALRDGVRSSTTVRPDPASAADGFGDTATAAVQKTSDNLVQDIQGVTKPSVAGTNVNLPNDPIERAKAILPTGYQLDREAIKANPGPLSRELQNRLVEQSNTNQFNVLSAIENTAKVQQLPLEEATQQVYTQLKDAIRNQYPSIKNAIGDIGDPVPNPIGNNYNFPVRIINWTGEQFSSEAVARKFAKENGILEYDLKGKEGARYYVPEAAIKRPYESTSRLGETYYKDGQLRVFTDDGAEVQTSLTPQAGHVPVEILPGGDFKFHPTLRSDEEVARAVVAQQGLGFHLITWKPLDINQHVLKDLVKTLDSTKSIASNEGAGGWANSIFGYFRTADATLSPFETRQRKVATGSINNYHKMLQDQMKYVEDVARGRVRVDDVTGQDVNSVWSYIKSINPISKIQNRQTFNEFKRFLDAGRLDKDPATGRTGRWFNQPEMAEFYQTNFHREPTFREVQGYQAFRDNYENNRVLSSLREYTNKVTRGAEQHHITFTDAAGEKHPSGFFEGVTRKELPGGEDPILVMEHGHIDIRMTNNMGSRYKDIAEDVRMGRRVVTELWNAELRPLQTIPGVGNNYVRYVLSDSRETKALDWNQVNRLGGGHFEYNYTNYIKEANVSRSQFGQADPIHRYEGDKTFMPVANRAQGRQIVNVLNAVKKHLVNGNENQARDVFENGLRGENGPAMEWKDFLDKTRPRKIKGITQSPSVDIHEPYYVVPKGKSILDLDKSLEDRYSYTRPNGTKVSTFKDSTKSGSLARQYQVAYTQERDSEALKTLNVYGSKNNPIYKYEPAEFVDPITTLNRALNQVSSQSFMDDVKVAGMETWLREAEDSLKADKSEIRSAPFYHFHNASDASAFKSAADKTKVWNLLSNRFKTLQFLGVPSKYDVFMHETAQKIADWSFDKFGPTTGGRVALVPTWLLGNTKSPVQILRSLAYHTKLGLFAIPQLLVQSQTYLTIGALAPRSAVSGTFGAMLHQWSRWSKSPEFLAKLDDYATKLRVPGFHNWKVGEFTEAMKELDRRGFAHVGGEYSTLDTQLKHQFVKSEFDGFLDLGQMFFRGAEQNVRYGAWYTAYKEYRASNPNLSSLSRTDWDKIASRADDMAGNMSRASNSILQSGPLALTGQFLTYQMHLAELFWGKRVAGDASTMGERSMARMRMYAMYATMFGLPGAIGITGVPATERIRQYSIDHGYVVGDNWLQSTVNEGIPALFLAWATGGGDSRKGNWYNINDRLGAGGMTQFNDALKSDAKWWQLIGGASTSIAANTINNSTGWTKAMYSMMTGKTGDEAFPMKSSDWVDLFKEVSSVKAIWGAQTAISTGKWLSKNEGYQTDVTPLNAIFMSATGLNLQEAADNYVVGLDRENQKDMQKYALNKFVEEFHRGIQSATDNDNTSYKQFMTRAFGYLKASDYPLDKYATAISIASKGYESRINSIREQFYTQDVPQGREQEKMDTWQRYLKLQDYKK